MPKPTSSTSKNTVKSTPKPDRLGVLKGKKAALSTTRSGAPSRSSTSKRIATPSSLKKINTTPTVPTTASSKKSQHGRSASSKPPKKSLEIEEDDDEDDDDDDFQTVQDWDSMRVVEGSSSPANLDDDTLVLKGLLSPPLNTDEETEDDEEDDEDDGVTQEAIDQIMTLVGPDEIPEAELEAVLSLAQSDQVDPEEEDDDDEEDDDEEALWKLSDESDSDEEEEEEAGVDYEAMSIGTDDEDIVATVRRKVVHNDEVAISKLLYDMQKKSAFNLDFFETQLVSHNEALAEVNANDDIARELALLKSTLSAATTAHDRFVQHDRPFFRPSDYFAEMVKSDGQMEKIRSRLVDEAAQIKASEEARRQRGLKKYGKAVQTEKKIERERETRRVKDGVTELRKKRKGATLNAAATMDEFDIALDDALDAARDSKRRATTSGARGGRGAGKGRMPRKARDERFGRPKPAGVTGRRWKENTKESSGAFAGFGGRGDGRVSSGGGGSRGGGRGGPGGGRGGGRGGNGRGGGGGRGGRGGRGRR